ncbi:hypothetical protein BK131_29160 [Paenibacillus amylolyticus]|uniref:Uncharacterized protein n=1 Tax=Paenibacillus amylolyticus TaxID=1451 RepID=A0A1R1BF39_PAEAM|nr:hypothetical protein BK131_29160 [Paenibacillus amylolyticus]
MHPLGWTLKKNQVQPMKFYGIRIILTNSGEGLIIIGTSFGLIHNDQKHRGSPILQTPSVKLVNHIECKVNLTHNAKSTMLKMQSKHCKDVII